MKKIKNMKKIITILLASILIFSCSKPKDNPTPVPTNTTTSVMDTIQFTINGSYFVNTDDMCIDSITTTGNPSISMKIGDTFRNIIDEESTKNSFIYSILLSVGVALIIIVSKD